MAALQGLSFNGRKCDIHYSIPKEGDRPEKSQVNTVEGISGGRNPS